MKYCDPLLPGGFYHIYNHAVGSENLFRTEENYYYFLSKFASYIGPVCRTYAYCLMPNHFHLLISVRSDEDIKTYASSLGKLNNGFDSSLFVTRQFSNLFNSYAKSYNQSIGRKGALFIDYFRRKQVSEIKYFTNLIHYIHANPVHHGFCNNLDEWNFSSYNSILSDKPSKLERQHVLNWYGTREEYKKIHLRPVSQFKVYEIEEFEFI